MYMLYFNTPVGRGTQRLGLTLTAVHALQVAEMREELSGLTGSRKGATSLLLPISFKPFREPSATYIRTVPGSRLRPSGQGQG